MKQKNPMDLNEWSSMSQIGDLMPCILTKDKTRLIIELHCHAK